MTSSVRRSGYEPLPDAGEYVCDCYEHGTGEPWAHVGSSHVHERIVRCRECKHFAVDQSDHEYRSGWWCKRWNTDMVEPTGYCAWGVRRKDA